MYETSEQRINSLKNGICIKCIENEYLKSNRIKLIKDILLINL